MDAKDIWQSFKRLAEAGVPSEREKLSVQRQAARWASPEALSAWRSEVNRARDEYRLGRYYKAEQMLQKLVTSLEPLVSTYRGYKEEGSRSIAQLLVLYASAKTLLGQTRDELGQHDRAQKDFKTAVELFTRWLPQTAPTGPEHVDHGVALHMVGREKDATAELNKQPISAEAYRYLGLRYREEGDYGRAEALLKRAVDLVPDDPLARKALAESIEAQRERDEDAIRAYQEAALAAAKDSRLEEALILLDRALTLNPEDPASLGLKAQLLRIAGRYEEVLQVLDRAVELSPDDPVYLETKGQTLRLLGRTDEALEVLDRVLELNPDNASALEHRGEALRLLGRYDDALQALDEALELSPDDARALGTKGQVLRAQNLNEAAAESLERAVRLDPDLAWAHAELGTTLLLLGRYDEALPALDRALELSPDDPVYLETKGQTLRLLGRTDEALEVLDRVLELNPDNASALKHRGEALRLLGRYDDALQALDEVLGKNAEDIWTLVTKGQVLRATQGDNEAQEPLERALSLDSDNASASKYKEGEALRLLGRYDDALQALDEALELSPDDAWALGTKGLVLRAQNLNEAAAESLERAVRLDPDLAWAHAELGTTLLLLGRYDEALPALDRVLELDPTNSSVLTDKGEVLRLLGRYDEALRYYDEAWEASKNANLLGGDDEAWILAGRGAVLSLLERPEEALQALHRALELCPDNTWVLIVEGEVLCNVAAFDYAIRDLDRAIELGANYAQAYALKGWALENLGVERARESVQAYENALEVDPKELRWHQGLADALSRLGNSRKADKKHKKIIEKLKKETAEAKALALRGWSHYRLAQWQEAMRFFGKALNLNPDLVYAQFDLALAATCSARCALGLENYQEGVDLVKQKDVLTRRGLLYVALREFEEAMNPHSELAAEKHTQEAHKLLMEAYRQADNEAAPKLAFLTA